MNKPIIPLYEYQKAWVEDFSQFKIGMFARQTGKTFISTLEIVQDCLKKEAQGESARWIILSSGERQAKEAMREGIQKWLEVHNLALQVTASNIHLENTQVNALEVTLPGGSRITALPANPDTARGFSGNVFLDEFAFHKDSYKIWQALFPVISGGYKIRITSTPNGKNNKFYELMTAKDNLYSRHTVNIHEAIKGGLNRDVSLLKAGLADQDAWQQEYELEWLDSSTAWLAYDLINKAENDTANKPQEYQNNYCYIGIDIAARRDLFVLTVIEKIGDVFWMRETIEKRNITFTEQMQYLANAIKTYKINRVCIDQTGMGEKWVEDAKNKHGNIIHGVMFTAGSKQHMAIQAKQIFEDGKIRIPSGNEALRQDLHSLKKEVSPTGVPKFVAEYTGKGDMRSHADRCWALFLAIEAGTSPYQALNYEGFKTPRQLL